MIDTLNKKQRQALALTILLLILMVVIILIVQLASLNRQYTDTINQLDRRLNVLQRVAASGDKLSSKHEQLTQLQSNNRQYLQSASEALAAAELQKIVKGVAAANRMELLSTQVLPTFKESGFTGITLKVRMRGKLSSLVRILYALETQQPYLFLDNVSIRSPFQNTSNVNLLEQLDIEFDLIGYMPGQS